MRPVAATRRCRAPTLTAAAAVLGLFAACSPAARPLRGARAIPLLPATALSAIPQRLQFEWRYTDETFEANGDGVVRVQGPARARLDFFLRNGMAGGYAILVDQELTVPGVDLVKRLLPPVPLLWATLGRVALPPTPDTVARVENDTLRVDLGVLKGADASKADGRAWRLTFAGSVLSRADRIEGGRLIEWISRERGRNGQWQLLYVHERGKRRLAITMTDTTTVEAFDDAIWRRPSNE